MAFIEGTSGNDTLSGTDGADEIKGLDGKDFIHGGRGNDTIDGGAGNDQLRGDDGDDLLLGGDGNDYISDGGGINKLEGGPGDDHLVVTGTLGSVAFGGSGNDDLVNARGNDTLSGGIGNDVLRSVLSTASTDPTVYTVHLNGDDGHDEFYASRLTASPDIVLATGGAGADTFSFSKTVFAYTATDFNLVSGDRIGLLRAFGESHDGSNPFTTGHVRIVQRGSNAIIQYDLDGSGNASQFSDVVILPGVDASRLTAAHFEGGVSPNGGTSGLDWTGTSLDDDMRGGILADRLFGGAGNDEMGGGPSADYLDGGAGDDFLGGGYGSDTLLGSDGNDVIWGELGDDHMDGGSGDDYLLDHGGGNNVLIGGDGNDELEVWHGDNTLQGGAGQDTLSGGPGNDLLYGGDGNDEIDGEQGIDFAYFSGPRENYRVQATYLDGVVEDLVGAGGLDKVWSVARLVFDDGAIAFLSDWTAMQVYCMYQAAFDRVPDAAGVGYWIAVRERGIPMHDIASAFITSAEFKSTYGSASSNEALVRLFYQNTLHREPDAPGVKYWTDRLDKGLLDVASVLEGFAGSYENELAVREQIPNGFEFIPYS